MADTPAITPVTLFTSGMAVPAIALEVLPYGLHVTKILLNANGRSNDVIISPYSNDELVRDRRMMNPIVGRYTNRLPVGVHEIVKGDTKATVSPVSNLSMVGLPHISIHGGKDGFDAKNWTRLSSQDTRNFSDSEKMLIGKLNGESVAIFSYLSKDGEEGFPGNLYTEVLFAVLPIPAEKIRDGEIELGSVVIVYRSRILPGGTAISPVNLTHHWGFNFSASVQRGTEPDANAHWVRVNASKRLELAPDTMPTGNIVDNKPDSDWDWKAGKKINDKPLERLDGYLFFDRPRTFVQPVHVSLQQWETDNLLAEVLDDSRESTDVPVEVYDEVSGVRAKFVTNQPGVQIYGGEGLRGAGTKKAIHGGQPVDGQGYTGRPGVFLEFHEPVNALFSKFGKEPGADTILSEGQIYNNYVKVAFSYKPEQ
ncbi:galactose mutarotase-like protein [Calocera cornea HHB12733]|uniref:Galactose mutarotase-like protein n=1 Tax=Calocera cornea HHB12733 TaxID=1353952 RepID=A0A165EA21_9BASI|nr:galactose mutarotase-like protein [Calocera cornea HHB12733]